MLGRTVYVIQPTTPKGKAWLEDNVPEGTWAMGGVVVEWRYLDDIWQAIKDDGMTRDVEVVS